MGRSLPRGCALVRNDKNSRCGVTQGFLHHVPRLLPLHTPPVGAGVAGNERRLTSNLTSTSPGSRRTPADGCAENV